jgi:uncharacterized caspase-like protein
LIQSLRYSVADANAIHQILLGVGGFRKKNVLLLTDVTDRPPTLANIVWALKEFLGQGTQRKTAVLLYFSGHGGTEVNHHGIKTTYLVPRDGDPDDLASTAVSMDRLHRLLDGLNADRLTVFLDASYVSLGVSLTPGQRSTRAIITAARTGEEAIESSELRHGLFTHYLLEGLRGAADRNGDKTVTLVEIYSYVDQQVVQKAQSIGRQQRPMLIFEGPNEHLYRNALDH